MSVSIHLTLSFCLYKIKSVSTVRTPEEGYHYTRLLVVTNHTVFAFHNGSCRGAFLEINHSDFTLPFTFISFTPRRSRFVDVPRLTEWTGTARLT